MKNIGFIGLGWMGLGMCKTLVRAKYNLTVFDVVKKPMDEIEAYAVEHQAPAVRKAESVKEVAENSDFIDLVVRNEDQYREIIEGKDGLLENVKPGTYIVIHGTVTVGFVQEMYRKGREKGVVIVDGPITGQKREEGEITVMLGSTEEEYEYIKSVIYPMGRILRIGESGAGMVAKLVNNMMATVHTGILAEALIFGEKMGVPKEALLEQLNNPESSGYSWSVSHWNALEQMTKIFIETNGGPAALTFKDLGIALQSAHQIDPRFALPLTSAVFGADIGRLPPSCLAK